MIHRNETEAQNGYDLDMMAVNRILYGLLITTVLVTALAIDSRAQQRQQPARGKLLVSSPELSGTAFAASVVLLIHHDDDGSIGVILNRPTTIEASQAFPESSALQTYEGIVHFGGPVAPARPLFLIRSETLPAEGNIRVLADVYLQGSAEGIDALPGEFVTAARVRVFAGHAEWGPGQLAGEIAAGGWQIVNGRTAHVFSDDPLALWQQVSLTGSTEVAALTPTSYDVFQLALSK